MARTNVSPPPASLMGPPNQRVFAYLQGLSAHSDIAAPLLAAVKPLPGVELHCSDRERFGYVTASAAGRVFAFAADMRGVAFRLAVADAQTARTQGAEAIDGLGPEWVLLPLFGDGGFADQLNAYARQAYAHAVSAGPDTPNAAQGLTGSGTTHLLVVAVIILIGAVWGASFSHSCSSDGCIGIVFPVGGSLLALAAQIFILIPAYGIKLARAKAPVGARISLWLAVSLAAFVLPMLFAKL